VAQAKAIVRRCLTPEQRDLYHLAPAPPSWCSTAQAWPYDIVSIVDAALDAVEKREIEPRHREALAVVAEAIAHDSNARARIAPILGRFNGIAFNRFLDTQLRGHTTNTLKDVLPLADIAVAFTEEKPDTLRDALDTRGQILFALGRTDEAFADLDKAITLGLRAAGTFYARGRVYELRGNRDAAINDYRESLSLSSSDADYADHVHELARDRLTALGDSPAFLQQ
jgi:tetratricopeptide (TPR) repeat protein